MSGMQKVIESAGKKIFRGGIAENCKRFRFHGDGYKAMPAEQNGQFWLESARQIAGPLNALIDTNVRITHVIGATQVLKSMSGDCWTPYVLEHWRLPMLILFEDQDKADLFCSMRLMDTIKKHPELSKLLAESSKESRFNVTGTWIKFPGASLLVAGMNEGNVSTISWPVIWVSEAWQHGTDGLLFKAFKRADRYAATCKILNESQASLVGTDLHTATKTAYQVPLTWRCPACDGEQTWEYRHWSFKRPDDFAPRSQKLISTIIIDGKPATVETLPKAGSYGGMKWNEPDIGSTITIEQKAASAYWECIWCGHHIQDTPDVRNAICRTYSQDYKVTENGVTRTPKEVCFTIPFEAAWDNRFEKTVAHFLTAKDSKSSGYSKPMEDWFLAERALFFDPLLEHKETSVSIGSYDPNEVMPDEHSRNMGVDCQQDQDIMDRTGKSVTGWFWYVIRAIDKFGNTKQLDRGFAKSWDEWRSVQSRWKVPNDRVCIDIGQWGTQIQSMAADQREIIRIEKPLPPFYLREKVVTWYLFDAEKLRKNFTHADGVQRPWSPPQQIPVPLIDSEGKSRRILLKKIRFDRDTFNLQLDAIRSGAPGMPKFDCLSREFLSDRTKEIETGDRTYSRQMDARYYVPEKKKYEELRADDHYQWCEIAILVRMAMDGLVGHVIE